MTHDAVRDDIRFRHQKCGGDFPTWHTFTVDGAAASRSLLEGKAEVRGARSRS